MSRISSSKSTRAIATTSQSSRSARWRRVGIFLVATVVVFLCLLTWLGLRFDPLGYAQADFDRRDYRASLKVAENYLKRWPGEHHASLMAARSASRLGQLPRAESHYAKAGTLDIDDLHHRAYGMVQMEQPARAIELYGELLQQRPYDRLALKRLAAVLMGVKRYVKLPEIASRLMAIPGEEVAGRTLSGIAHHVEKRYPEAAEEFLKVLELDPGLKLMPLPSALFWNHLAIDLLAQGKFTEARTYVERGLAETQDAGLTELLGTTYQQEGRAEEAERYWRLAVERDPNLHDAWLDLGQLAIARRRPQEAVEFLSRAAELAPDVVEPYQNLSVAYKMLGKTEQSERCRKMADELRARKSTSANTSRDREHTNGATTDGLQR